MSTTVYVSIGNSDDELSQAEWSEFVSTVDMVLRSSGQIHGSWYSLPASPFQNACWCVELADDAAVRMARGALDDRRIRFRQDSIAWAVAETEFI